MKENTKEARLAEAQNLIYQAWESPDSNEAVAFARQALKVSEECADAYCILAELDAESEDGRAAFFLAGVLAGKEALGPDFDEFKGHFWGFLETRPYMRALGGLAESLWALGKKEESIERLQYMLELNPGDNQGIRYILSARLLETGQDELLTELLNSYPDDASASFEYSKALLAYRAEGDSASSRQLLDAALKHNPFVPLYLTGKRRLPREMPSYVGFGDENEAIDFAARYKASWRKTKGAVPWLRRHSTP